LEKLARDKPSRINIILPLARDGVPKSQDIALAGYKDLE